MDDHFKSAALRVNDTKAVLAEEVSGIGNAVGLVFIGSAAGVDVAAAENGSEGILDEAAAVQLADLAVEYLAGSGILMYLYPLLGLAQIIRNRGMDNRIILTVDTRNAIFLHLGDCLVYHGGGKQRPAVGIRTAAACAHSCR